MQINQNKTLVWGFFTLVFVGANYLLLQRYPNPSLLSLIIALSLAFILDQLLKKRQDKDKKRNVTKDDPKFLRKKDIYPRKTS